MRSRAVSGFVVALSLNASVAAMAAPRTGEPITPIEPTKVENPALVELGKALFFDPRLSKSGAISCNSCHNLVLGGTDNLQSSIGHGWQLGPINSPTVLNSKFNVAQFWDGRAKDLVEQAGGPVANPGEMGFTHELAVGVIKAIPGYKPLFKAAYKDESVSMAKIQTAIAAFEETLVTPGSRFDRWLQGDDRAIDGEELAGYTAFKDKGCVGCHNGPAVGGTTFQKFGLVKEYKTASKALGRYDVTKNEADRNVFKVPTLRNVELTYPYFHDGSVWGLEEAVTIMGRHQLGIELTDVEARRIAAFLRTLTGEIPAMAMPKLPPSVAATPRPNPKL